MLFLAFSFGQFHDFSLLIFPTFFDLSFLGFNSRISTLELLNLGFISMEIETSIHSIYNSVSLSQFDLHLKD